ncbi:hypothetical protein QAD02_003835 [Eretmocerus hayati]|uniref:Uncharacterized protein n=1 Tax=Eretmocerus hayati TaxID=131215 RepID=A0ACC2NN58_9HYME|nr:hypothetical protein QAD02_003835 [Eretmocerus hayati]
MGELVLIPKISYSNLKVQIFVMPNPPDEIPEGSQKAHSEQKITFSKRNCGYCGNSCISGFLCSKCRTRYHESCSLRAPTGVPGIFECCADSMISDKIDSVSEDEIEFESKDDKISVQQNTLINQVNEIDQRLKVLENANAQNTNNVEMINAEIVDRMRRAANVVLFGVNEHPGNSDADSNDLSEAVRLLSRLIIIQANHIPVKRLGNDTAVKPRPLLVRLGSNNTAFDVLKNKHMLPNGITVAADRTQAQREFMRNLRTEIE